MTPSPYAFPPTWRLYPLPRPGPREATPDHPRAPLILSVRSQQPPRAPARPGSIHHHGRFSMIWIINNQLSRRNLTPEDKTYLIGIQYKLEKKEVGVRGPEKMDQNDPSFSTAEKIAEQHHVSPATVKRAEKFAEAVDKLSPEEKTEVLAGRSDKTKQEIKAFPLTEIRCPSIRGPY